MKNMTHIVLLISFAAMVQTCYAGSATWKPHPHIPYWTESASWTPETIPNGPDDIATFGLSFRDTIQISYIVLEVNSIIFTAEAADSPSPYLIDASHSLIISGAGITNNSAITQTITGLTISFRNSATAGNLMQLYGGALEFHDSSDAGSAAVSGLVTFYDSATAERGVFTILGAGQFSGSQTIVFFDSSSADFGSFSNRGATFSDLQGGRISFFESSTAANGSFTNFDGGINSNGHAGTVDFNDNATAGDATFTNMGGTDGVDDGGSVSFFNNSSAGNGTLISTGGTVIGTTGGRVQFFANSTASNSTLVASGGPAAGTGALIQLLEDSVGGSARIEVFGNASLDIVSHNAPEVTVGSIEGDGQVLLGSNNLTTGSNNLSTTFSGTIVGRAASLTKIGTGNLTLTGANTFTGGMIVNGGILLANNTNGSGTGSGPVLVTAGTFGGGGRVSGTVSVGTGSGAGAFLGPGATGVIPGTLTIRKKLTLMADATYKVTMNSSSLTADKVSAKGVKIRGAQILLDDRATSVLPTGTVFTIINNTAAPPISGTFANLPDGGTVIVGSNTFQADYEGGDGNDLTLTVVSK